MTSHVKVGRTAIAAVMLLVAASTQAQTPCRERVLIPITANRVPGLNGSVWQTHLAITNQSARPVSVLGHGVCQFNPCPNPDDIAAESTIYPRAYMPYLSVPCDRSHDVSFQFRVQDLSRQSQTWGTSIPVVRERDLFDGRNVSVTDIPNGPEFRSMLRVYGFDPGREATVTIRIFGLDETITESGRGDKLLASQQHVVAVDPLAPNTGPAYLQVPLWMVPEALGASRIRVEIEGAPGFRLWAFISATNNVTQHVTVLVPE